MMSNVSYRLASKINVDTFGIDVCFNITLNPH